MSADRREAIEGIYAAVGAPSWAAPNLDGLADVLRDLSWLPVGPVTLRWAPSARLRAQDRRAIEHVLRAARRETVDGPRPVSVRGID